MSNAQRVECLYIIYTDNGHRIHDTKRPYWPICTINNSLRTTMAGWTVDVEAFNCISSIDWCSNNFEQGQYGRKKRVTRLFLLPCRRVHSINSTDAIARD
jgi:hypothetical protein